MLRQIPFGRDRAAPLLVACPSHRSDATPETCVPIALEISLRMLIRFNWLHNVSPRANYNLSLATRTANCSLPVKTQFEIAKCQTIEREPSK